MNLFFGLYNLLAPVLLIAARGLQFFLPKLERSFSQRQNVMDRWRSKIRSVPEENRIWFHVASVGEYERVLPTIEAWAQKKPEYNFILSFFSPEVLRFQKELPYLQVQELLPFDLSSDMDELVSLVNPRLVVLDRYDIWPNFLYFVDTYRIPIALINASVPPLGLWGQLSLFVRQSLFEKISYWTFVDAMAAGSWEPYIRRTAKGLVTGNPRVDQALVRAEQARQKTDIFAQLRAVWQFDKQKTIVAGSTWEEDEKLIFRAFAQLKKEPNFKQIRLLVVPHEPSEESNARLAQNAKGEGLELAIYSQTLDQSNINADVLVFDKRGLLAELYSCGYTAYVGGGFGVEVHSTIEPAAHHLPVAFGPKFLRSPDAKSLVFMGAAKSFNNDRDSIQNLCVWFRKTLQDSAERDAIVESVNVFLTINRGAGLRIANFLNDHYDQSQKG